MLADHPFTSGQDVKAVASQVPCVLCDSSVTETFVVALANNMVPSAGEGQVIVRQRIGLANLFWPVGLRGLIRHKHQRGHNYAAAASPQLHNRKSLCIWV